jgi:pseudaminic acid synthase
MDKPEIEIAGRKISSNHPPYVIAELSANHNGSFETALKIIDEAAKSGADAIKLQTYKPDTITLDSDLEEFKIQGGLWDGRTLYDLYEEAHMPWDWHKPLFEHASERGITIFSSPFDKTAVDLLEDLNVPAYKIASFEVIDIPLIRYVASTGKPMIISTGMAQEDEIFEAVETAKQAGCHDIAVLHCVSGYPAPIKDCNLATIADMSGRFGLVTGLSDHSLGSVAAIASVALGASIIEKHFTLDRSGGGPDDSFSIEPDELEVLCSNLRNTWLSIGEPDYNLKVSEIENVKFRRSLYAVKPIFQGELITVENVKSIRPGYGLAPKHLDSIIGKAALHNINRGQAISWSLVG